MKCVLLILTIISTTAFGQDDEAAVKQVVNQLFEGMKKSDTSIIRSAFTANPVLQTIVKNREGKISVASEPLDSFLVSISRPHTGAYDEQIRFDVIRIDGELAMVWAPYKFFVGDKFSHCGVDAFQVVKINKEWKIQYLIDTRRRQDCE